MFEPTSGFERFQTSRKCRIPKGKCVCFWVGPYLGCSEPLQGFFPGDKALMSGPCSDLRFICSNHNRLIGQRGGRHRRQGDAEKARMKRRAGRQGKRGGKKKRTQEVVRYAVSRSVLDRPQVHYKTCLTTPLP